MLDLVARDDRVERVEQPARDRVRCRRSRKLDDATATGTPRARSSRAALTASSNGSRSASISSYSSTDSSVQNSSAAGSARALGEERVHARVRQADGCLRVGVGEHVAVRLERALPGRAGERLGVDERAVAVEDDGSHAGIPTGSSRRSSGKPTIGTEPGAERPSTRTTAAPTTRPATSASHAGASPAASGSQPTANSLRTARSGQASQGDPPLVAGVLRERTSASRRRRARRGRSAPPGRSPGRRACPRARGRAARGGRGSGAAGTRSPRVSRVRTIRA